MFYQWLKTEEWLKNRDLIAVVDFIATNQDKFTCHANRTIMISTEFFQFLTDKEKNEFQAENVGYISTFQEVKTN